MKKLKQALSLTLALALSLALALPASAAGVEDYKYIKFSNEPNSITQLTVASLATDYWFPDVSFAVCIFPDDTTYTVTVPDGGLFSYACIEPNQGGWGGNAFIDNSFIEGRDPVTNRIDTKTVTLAMDEYYLWKWNFYDSEEYRTPEEEQYSWMEVPARNVIEEIYFMTQTALDSWIAEGVATVSQTAEPEQPTTPSAPTTPTAPATPPAGNVVLSPQKLTVDGSSVECEKYNIVGSNYFKLRDLAYALNGTGSQFGVGYDEATATVTITTGEAYTPTGTEMAEGVDNSSTAKPSSQTIKINGAEHGELTVYNIGGSNFFQLRELGSLLGFDVDFDQNTNTAVVRSTQK